jgi:hypothetical protein
MKRVTVLAGILATFLISSLTSVAQTPSREEVLDKIKAKRAELVALEKTYLAPAEEDQVQYAAFIHVPNSGLVRLLPREKFDTESYTDRDRAIVTRGGGAYYSFTKLSHEYGYATDIELAGNQFTVGFAGLDYGFLTNLGDVPLENVGMGTPAFPLFAAYKPPREEPEVRTEQRRFAQGSEIEGVQARRTLPVKLNSTYLMRSMTFREADVLVAFKVVRLDSDGSVTLLWKLLKKYKAPDINRAQTAAAQ